MIIPFNESTLKSAYFLKSAFLESFSSTVTTTLQFLLFYFALCIVLDVAALQFVGRSISVFLTFNILLCTVYLCWTWLHCSCWSLNIGAFSNYLTINQFYLFLCLQHSHLHTPSLPNLGTLSLGIPYHTCNATKVARETTVFFCFFLFFFQSCCAKKSVNQSLRHMSVSPAYH